MKCFAATRNTTASCDWRVFGVRSPVWLLWLVLLLVWFATLPFTLPASQALPVAWERASASQVSPQGWQSLSSEHFEIFFRPPLKPLAQRSLLLAEQVHQELVPFFSDVRGRVSLPPEATRMVLVDEFDVSNGWATPFPFAQIRLYASPPQDMNGLESIDDWLHGLIRHEYVHVLHTEMANGITDSARDVFGRTPLFPLLVPLSPFPHALTPSLMLEGLAVYLETNEALGYGRLQSHFYQMMMRTEVASGDLLSLGEAVTPARSFPANRAYLYGAFFIEFLVERYGELRLRYYLQNYSNELLAYFTQQQTARQAFGKTFNQLWPEFLDYLTERFKPSIDSLASQVDADVTVVESQKTAMAMLASNADAVVSVNTSRHDRSTLMRYREGESQSLTHQKGIIAIDVAEDEGLLVARLLPYANGRVWADLFSYRDDLGWQRLTYQQRFRKARWLTARQIIASRNVQGRSELWLLTLGAHSSLQQQLLWRGEYGDVLADFDVWKEGDISQLVASIKRPQQGWNLELARLTLTADANVESAVSWQPLTQTRATENSPEFSDANTIIFSADYDGVFNLFQLDLRHPDTLLQLTRTQTGAFNPSRLGEQLYYSRYQHDGYQLVTQPWQPKATLSLAGVQGRYDFPQQPKAVSVADSERNSDSNLDSNKDSSSDSSQQPQPYTLSRSAFWRSIRPHTWLPFYQSSSDSTQVGALTAGSDALGRHRYSVLLNRDTDFGQWNGQLLYQYDNRWRLGFVRNHESLNSFRLDEGDVVENIQRSDSWLLQRDFIAPLLEDQLTLHIGAIHERDELVGTSFARDESLVGVALRFDNRELFRDVRGVGWGSYFDLIGESNDVLDSDYDGDVWQTRFAHQFDLPGRIGLGYEVVAGFAERTAEPFFLGSDSGEEGQLFGRNKYRLRGYDSGVQQGHYIYRQTVSFGFPLARIDNNWNLNPLGLMDISANVFAESGKAWFRRQNRDTLTSIGAEITTELVLGYRLLLPVKVGYAHGLDEANGRTSQSYVSIGLFF